MESAYSNMPVTVALRPGRLDGSAKNSINIEEEKNIMRECQMLATICHKVYLVISK